MGPKYVGKIKPFLGPREEALSCRTCYTPSDENTLPAACQPCGRLEMTVSFWSACIVNLFFPINSLSLILYNLYIVILYIMLSSIKCQFLWNQNQTAYFILGFHYTRKLEKCPPNITFERVIYWTKSMIFREADFFVLTDKIFTFFEWYKLFFLMRKQVVKKH